MDSNLNRRLDIRLDALLMEFYCFQKDPVPAAFGQFFESLILIKRQAVSHSCHAISFDIQYGKLILFNAVEEFVPIRIQDEIVEHEFLPGCGRDITCTVAIIFEVFGRDDFKTRLFMK